MKNSFGIYAFLLIISRGVYMWLCNPMGGSMELYQIIFIWMFYIAAILCGIGALIYFKSQNIVSKILFILFAVLFILTLL